MGKVKILNINYYMPNNLPKLSSLWEGSGVGLNIKKMNTTMTKKLYRSDDKMLGGVCAGLAEYLDTDPTVVRLLYAGLTFFTAFSGVILYPILWIIMPEKR